MQALNLRETLSRRRRSEWIVFLLLLAVSAGLGQWLSASTFWIKARSAVYQVLTTLGGPPRYPQRTAIVLLNDDDYWRETPSPEGAPPFPQLAGRSPSNRAYLAALIMRLTELHVAFVVLDIDLRSPDAQGPADDLPEYDREDQALFAALHDLCGHAHQIVLATELVSDSQGASASHGVTETRNIYDSAGFDSSCVHQGYIELPRDIRRVPVAVPAAPHGSTDSLALAAVKAVDPVAYGRIEGEGESDFPFSQFMPLSAFNANGPGQTLFSGREIRSGDAGALTPLLLNRIVLIGADWHTLGYGQGPSADSHPTPAKDLPGVLLHANYIEAALQHGTSNPFPERVAIVLEVLLVLFLSLFGMLPVHPAWKWCAVIISSIGVLVFSYVLLRTFGLMLDFFFPLIFVGLHSAYEHISEWRHEAREE